MQSLFGENKILYDPEKQAEWNKGEKKKERKKRKKEKENRKKKSQEGKKLMTPPF